MMASAMDLKSLCIVLVVPFNLDISALTSEEVSFHDSSSTIVLDISSGKAYIKIFKKRTFRLRVLIHSVVNRFRSKPSKITCSRKKIFLEQVLKHFGDGALPHVSE